MQLHFIDRTAYRNKTEPEFLKDLKDRFGDFYLIPEGGTNGLAIHGTSEILRPEDQQFSFICSSIGTGGTFAGLYASLSPTQSLTGFSSLKGDFINKEVSELIRENRIYSEGRYSILTQFHFGGYAKFAPQLVDFIWWFYENFGIVLDPIYTGKMAYGLWELIRTRYFSRGSKVLMIHTGGLQGNVGFTERTGIKLPIPAPRDLQSRG